jgi:hypothetical protein
MRSGIILLLIIIFISADLSGQTSSGMNSAKIQGFIINSSALSGYVEKFNQNDNELYPEFISNSSGKDFLIENIPLFECPDKQIEETYYFRWWTYRKHIKQTEEGFVITEFLPDVPWSGKYNTISCAAAFHFYEGRWLHHQEYLNDYARFWLHGGGNPRLYSFWISDALYNQFMVTNDTTLIEGLFPDLVKNYESWEKENLDSTGLFWQIDGRDGMEMSVCGSGYRATINSYMYGDAIAISKMASMLGKNDLCRKYNEKATVIKRILQSKLWDDKDSFFKVLPRGSGSQLCSVRELHGYTPWYFSIPDKEYSQAWKFIMDPQYFFAPFALTTTEQNKPGFIISYEGHECQWNGPGWPYATSITLTAMANLLNNYSQNYVSMSDYFKLLAIYSKSHQLRLEDGNIIPWIDENLNPLTGDWISRTRLKTWDNGTWSKEKGGVERGKDYNHSTFCDLIISGLIGLRPQPDNSLIINPLLPDNTWEYFCLDNILYHGKIITIMYDKTGKNYNKGKGFKVWIDGKLKAASPHPGLCNIKKI